MSISQDWITNELEDTELEALHRSPSVEYSFYNAVRAGDMEAVNKNCEEDSFLHLKGTGILSKNPLTNLKYHFVVTTAMLTRYCIDGGLESEQAYRLNGTFVVPTKFLCFPVSEIHREAELYVLQESAIWLLLLINVHLFYKAVKKFFLLQIDELII